MYSRGDVEEIARKAAAEGARLVLRDLGIPSDEAGMREWRKDIHEARDFMTALRVARHTVWVTAVKWGTVAVISLLIAGAGWGLHDKIR
jgi:hypothetical protein